MLKRKLKFKNIALALLAAVFALSGIFGGGPADLTGGLLETKEARAIPAEITVDLPTEKNRILDWFKKIMDIAKRRGVTSAITSATQNFTQKLAYDAAVKIAEGGPGGQALGWNLDWGTYLKDAREAALGDFIGSISELWGVDLCDPGALQKIDITFGLIASIAKPPKPRCDWKDIQRSWKKLDEGAFAQKLSFMFEPKVNYLGSAFALKSQMEQDAKENEELAKRARGVVTGGFKAITSPISKTIKVPSDIVEEIAKSPMNDTRTAWLSEKIGSYLSADIMAPAFNTFFSTLTGKLMEKWANKGMFAGSSGSGSSITNPESSATYLASQNETKAMYGDLIEPSFGAGGSYDILSDFASCPFPDQPGPTNCVIDTAFQTAIEEELTVGQAMNKKYLKAANTFALKSDGTKPDYNEGYSLRNMIILRNYRVLPVGWEIAAQYIEQFAGDTSYTLGDMVACYSATDDWEGMEASWCRGMVDPSWVLKAPANNCEKEAYGQEIITEIGTKGIDMNNDGKYYDAVDTTELDDNDSPPKLNITRNEFCAESKSCLMERDDGSCLKWGTCLEEKRIWKFEGDGCDAQFNSCMEYTSITPPNPPFVRGGAGSGGGRTTSPLTKGGSRGVSSAYLRNTLDYGVCGPENAGCGWLCQYYDKENEQWKCGIDSAYPLPYPDDYSLPTPPSGALFFNNAVKECSQSDEGCRKYIKLTPGANLVYNGGFDHAESAGETELNLDGQSANVSDIVKFNDWPIEKTTSSDFAIRRVVDDERGGWVYKITTNGGGNGLYFYDSSVRNNATMMPGNYRFDLYKSYTFSADVKVISGKVKIGLVNAGNPSSGESVESTKTDAWERLIVELPAEEQIINKAFIHSVGGAEFYVDNIQLEESGDPSLLLRMTQGGEGNWKEYGDYSRVAYIKKAPDYLDCKNNLKDFNDGLAKDTLTDSEIAKYESILAECANYAMECTAEQVGCDKYSPVNGDPWIPAIVSEEDRCDYECVNYKSYKQGATNFEAPVMNVNFIADNPYLRKQENKKTRKQGLGEGSGTGGGSTGIACSAQDAGCSEFTNLDELAEGGEAKEYYSSLKRCVKPSDAGVSCGTFYTWIGSDTAGYQLKEHYLQKTSPDSPKVINNPQDFGECNNQQDAIDNAAYCKEFYNENGDVSYKILQNTVSCSENCHPYRQTRDRINQSQCALYGSSWSGGVCQLEKDNCDNSGGDWNSSELECIYKAIPGEGKICSAAKAGCREYKGATSANVKVILKDQFEGMDSDGWENAEQSNRSSYFTGHSLTSSGSSDISKDLSASSELKLEKTYTVSFLANYNSTNKHTVKIQLRGINFIAERTVRIENNATDDWNIYQAGPMVLTGDLDENGQIDQSDVDIINNIKGNPTNGTAKQQELADINGDGTVTATDVVILKNYKDHISDIQEIAMKNVNSNLYFDNIIIKRVQENLYLIKDSWTVPEKCDEPITGFQIGCEEYKNMAGDLVQLKSFTDICPSEAVGCARMIDTYNSDTVLEQVFNEGDDSEIVVPADRIIYMVDDVSKECRAEDKGCQRLGIPQFNGDRTTLLEGNEYMGDVYLINNPDNYGGILCESEAVNCSEFQDDNGNKNYFKDPGDKVCEWVGGEWVKHETREGDVGNTKSANGTCPVKADLDFTIGENGMPVEMPTDGWVGLCPASQSGCAEYIDPLSDNNSNIVFNGNIEQDIDEDGKPDGWDGAPDCKTNLRGYGITKALVNNCKQTINFPKPGLYTLSALVRGSGKLTIQGCHASSPDNSMSQLNDTAVLKFMVFQPGVAVSAVPLEMKSGRFHIDSSDLRCELVVDGPLVFSGRPTVDEISIRETGVYYNLADSVKGCSIEDYSNYEGCVLVNERNLSGTVLDANGAIEPVYAPLNYSSNLAVSGADNIMCEKEKNALKKFCDVYSPGGSMSQKCEDIMEELNKGFCSANKLIKAKQDRVCDRWINDLNAEQITNTQGETEKKVYDVGECNSLDESGQCARQVKTVKENVEFSSANVGLMSNISGMSKVGFQWDNNYKIKGNYSISNMSQFGQMINFQGGFERAMDNGEPVGWDSAEELEDGALWDPVYFEVINNPNDSQSALGLEVKAAPEGRNFLKLNGKYQAFTKYFPAYDDTEYVISGSINSSGLEINGSAQIQVALYNRVKERIDKNAQYYARTLSLDSGKPWTFLSKRFKIDNSDVAFLRIELINYNGAEKSVGYFDDISILPALELRDNLDSNDISAIAPSICKIYPKEDSLACEYVGDEGLSYRGERGYCLEYDRAPGDPNICISWYPVNIIRGDEEVEMPLFNEGIPLFFCAEAQLLEYRRNSGKAHCSNCYPDTCPPEGGYKCEHCTNTIFNDCDDCDDCCGRSSGGTKTKDGCCKPTGEVVIPVDDGEPNSDFYDYNGEIRRSWRHYETGDKNWDTREFYEELLARCTKIVQLAKLGGENRAWFDRMKSNTDYKGVPDLKFTEELYAYNSFNSPYGALIDPNGDIIYNITDEKDALQIIKTTNGEYTEMPQWGLPYSASSTHFTTAYYAAHGDDLQFISFGDDVQNSIKGAIDRLKNLFTESYLAWEWNDDIKQYEVVDSFEWTDSDGNTQIIDSTWEPPENLCPNNRRLDIMTLTEQFCGIPPKIDNIKIGNKTAGDVVIGRSDSVLLKFTSEVDKEQAPLTAYYIDWRDGTDSIAEELRVMNKSNSDNPHIFSHFYDYETVYNASPASCYDYDDPECASYNRGSCCKVKPRIRIKDNWDWCSDGVDTDPCPGGKSGWDVFDGSIVVSER